jgi:CubicO group peptidase (beta-lactamase class C family)
MEYAGSWSTDSESSDFEKMETGVNARAIDFAKFGFLYLEGGVWQGQQVISPAWVEQSTQPYFPTTKEYYSQRFAFLPGRAYYQYMWWGFMRSEESYDFAAEGDRGQFIYVSPSSGLVIVRNGTEYGIPPTQWLKLFYDFATQY